MSVALVIARNSTLGDAVQMGSLRRILNLSSEELIASFMNNDEHLMELMIAACIIWQQIQ